MLLDFNSICNLNSDFLEKSQENETGCCLLIGSTFLLNILLSYNNYLASNHNLFDNACEVLQAQT